MNKQGLRAAGAEAESQAEDRSCEPTDAVLYGGISGVELSVDAFDLGEGVVLRRTYAHLMSLNLMAFRRAKPGQPHPGPVRPAHGGRGVDIEVEIRAPQRSALGPSFDAKETIWWIAALLRLAKTPYLSVTVLSNCPYSEVPVAEGQPTLQPMETEPRMFQAPDATSRILDKETLCWVRASWVPAGRLLDLNTKLYSALRAFDLATVRGRTSSSLLALWGAIEQLFAPSPGELRFRVASLLASYLERPGPKRLHLYKKILKLYDARSTAAHTAEEVAIEPLVESYVLMRNTLVKMISENKVPAQPDLETLLFGADLPSDGES